MAKAKEAETAKSDNKSVLSKLTVKTIGCAGAKGANGKVLLARFYGIAKGIKSAEGTDGDLLFGVTGDFRAINVDKPDHVFMSGVMYLPGGVNEMLVAAVDTGEVDAKDRPIYAEIKFAFDVFSMPSTNKAGYQYEVVPIVDTVENDAMSELASDLPPLPGAKAIAAE